MEDRKTLEDKAASAIQSAMNSHETAGKLHATAIEWLAKLLTCSNPPKSKEFGDLIRNNVLTGRIGRRKVILADGATYDVAPTDHPHVQNVRRFKELAMMEARIVSSWTGKLPKGWDNAVWPEMFNILQYGKEVGPFASPSEALSKVAFSTVHTAFRNAIAPTTVRLDDRQPDARDGHMKAGFQRTLTMSLTLKAINEATGKREPKTLGAKSLPPIAYLGVAGAAIARGVAGWSKQEKDALRKLLVLKNLTEDVALSYLTDVVMRPTTTEQTETSLDTAQEQAA